MRLEVFQTGILTFTSCIKGLEVKTEELEMWFSLLNDLPDKIFLEAIKSLCHTQKEFYNGTNVVALIRDKVYEIRCTFPKPSDAWEEFIVKKRHLTDGEGEPVWSHPVIKQVVEEIGWGVLVAITPENATAYKALFEKILRKLVSKEERENKYNIEQSNNIALPEGKG